MQASSGNHNIITTIRTHKTLFIIIMVGLFLLELEIFAVAAMKSGRKSMLQISDQAGRVVFLSEGASLSQIDRSAFERTFGPLSAYRVEILSEKRAFPFRAWFVAAVGLPVGLLLLFAFTIKVWSALFIQNDTTHRTQESPLDSRTSGLERIARVVSRFNIFLIGVLIFVSVVAYWVLPGFFTYIGRTGLETIVRYKWAVLGVAMVVVGIFIWIVYLRYLLAKKSIESQVEVEKYRIQIEHQESISPQITYDGDNAVTTKQISQD